MVRFPGEDYRLVLLASLHSSVRGPLKRLLCTPLRSSCPFKNTFSIKPITAIYGWVSRSRLVGNHKIRVGS